MYLHNFDVVNPERSKNALLGSIGKALHKATPIKCHDQDYTTGQLKLSGWLYTVFIFYTICIEQAPSYWQFGKRAPNLLVILKRRHHFVYLFCLELCLPKLEFYFMVLLLRGWLVVQNKLFYWCGLTEMYLTTSICQQW